MSATSFYLILSIGAFFIGLYIYYFLLKRSAKYSLKKANTNGVRWASQSKPIFGGIGFFLIFITSLLAYLFYFDASIQSEPLVVCVLLVITLSFLMGLSDDIINTSPYFKFVVQIICAFILIYFDVHIDISPYPVLNNIITVLWVVGIMNSFNMLDNMDAITSSVSLITLLGMLAYILLSQQASHPIFIVIIIGSIASLVSFLFYNWHPAKMYMGDNGSQFLGSLLAILGIVFIWNPNRGSSFDTNSKQVIAVALAFLVPMIDTTCVTINRLSKGKSPFVGGKDHTTHHLSYLGLSDRGVALVLMSLSAISTLLSVVVTIYIEQWTMLYFVLFAVFCLACFVTLFTITRVSKPKVKNESTN